MYYIIAAVIAVALVALSGCVGSNTQVQPSGGDVGTVPSGTPDTGVYTPPVQFEDPCSGLTGEMRDGCYVEVVRGGRETSLCNKIGSADLKSICLAFGTKDPSHCGAVSDEYTQFQCFSDLAKLNKDKGVCAGIQKDSYKRICEVGVSG